MRLPVFLPLWVGLLGCGPPPGVHFDHPALTEPSGLVASRQYPGVFWTHNDSGGEADLFAVSATGGTLARIPVLGATQVDWEAVTTDDAGRLYIGDFGNNLNARRDLKIYIVAEPDPRAALGVKVDRVIHFRYPDQTHFPPAQLNFDAESLFWSRGQLYVLTKHRGDNRTKLYRFPQPLGSRQTLEQIGAPFELGGAALFFGGRATDASVTADGRFLAVLSYHAIFLFERPEGNDDYLSRPVRRIPLNQLLYRQCESIAWDHDDLLVTNEGGRIFRISSPLKAAVKK